MDALILGLRVVVALGAVLGLMWFLQRRLGKGTGRRRADRALTIVSRQSLGQKASVVVVDAAGQRFLLGVTEHAVNVLHTGDIPPEPEEVPVPGTSRGLGDFARILADASPLAGNHFSGQASGAPLTATTSRTAPTPTISPTVRTASGTCRRPAAAPFTGTPSPRPRRPWQRRRRVGPSAAARLHPGRLHLEAGCRRAQERTPQLIFPLPTSTTRPRTAGATTPQAPGPGARRRALCRPPAVAQRLGRPRRTHRPGCARAADRPCQSRRRERQHPDQRDGRQTLHRRPDPDRHHAAVRRARAAADDDVLHQDLRGAGHDPQRARPCRPSRRTRCWPGWPCSSRCSSCGPSSPR